MQVVTLPQLFRQSGYNTTGAGKIFHPGTPSGGFISSEGGGDMCPGTRPDHMAVCTEAPNKTSVASWSLPYFFCDQYTNDTVQSPMMQQFPCASDTWEGGSCGSGCVQSASCVACLTECGTWGKPGMWDACDCPSACYPEGVIAAKTVAVFEDKKANPTDAPWFHAVGFKRPHLTYRAPKVYFDMYNLEDIKLPLHRHPSPTAPGISYSHSCTVASNSTGPPAGSLRFSQLQQDRRAF